ncbi:MAG: TolC family protein [Bryobacterales bacterium]|nr:TolC family protein [Bryobacterales bacterium]
MRTRLKLPLALMLPLAATCAQSPPALKLSLQQAVELALAPSGNTRVQLAREMIEQAQSRANQARAALLPNIDGYTSYQDQTRNLAAFGIRLDIPVPGFRMPELVGPFSVFDARLTGSQTVFDFSAIRRYQAGRTGVEAAKLEDQSAQDQVTDQVARSYVTAQRAQAVVDAARADVELGTRLLNLARSQKAAGTGTGIEVTRAEVQLANQRQRLLVAENALSRAQLQLLRTMGVELDARIELSDELRFVPALVTTVSEALKTALSTRADLAAQQKREKIAEFEYSAAKFERLPSLAAFGDYGSVGSSVTHALPARTYGVSLRVPIFDGGRRDARRAASGSLYRQEQIRTEDLRQQAELDVRTALDSLQSAEAQIKAASEGLDLAREEVASSERRYQAGVTTSIEVTDAQTRLERARQNHIDALFNYSVAKIDLNTAMGTIGALVSGSRP